MAAFYDDVSIDLTTDEVDALRALFSKRVIGTTKLPMAARLALISIGEQVVDALPSVPDLIQPKVGDHVDIDAKDGSFTWPDAENTKVVFVTDRYVVTEYDGGEGLLWETRIYDFRKAR